MNKMKLLNIVMQIKVKWKPLNGLILAQKETYNINQLIIISESTILGIKERFGIFQSLSVWSHLPIDNIIHDHIKQHTLWSQLIILTSFKTTLSAVTVVTFCYHCSFIKLSKLNIIIQTIQCVLSFANMLWAWSYQQNKTKLN
jgi:hypothetical protein